MFDRSLLKFERDDVIYNGIKIGLTRQNLFDYVSITGFTSESASESLILLHYKESLSRLRDEQLENLLNEKNTN
jgi:hypothetical protein